MNRNTILLLMNWISIHLQCVFMGLPFCCDFEEKVLSFNHLQMELCVGYIWFIFRLIYVHDSNRSTFNSKSFRLKGRKRTRLSSLSYVYVYVCQCVLYLIASLFVWMHRSGTYWWFPLVYSFGNGRTVCEPKSPYAETTYIFPIYLSIWPFQVNCGRF